MVKRIWSQKPSHSKRVIATERGWEVEDTGEVLRSDKQLLDKLAEEGYLQEQPTEPTQEPMSDQGSTVEDTPEETPEEPLLDDTDGDELEDEEFDESDIAEAQQVDEESASSETPEVDTDLYKTDQDGNIIYNKDGSPRKKPGRKS